MAGLRGFASHGSGVLSRGWLATVEAPITDGALTSLTDFTCLFKQLTIIALSIYTLSDLGVLSNLIGSLSLANEHYSPPTE